MGSVGVQDFFRFFFRTNRRVKRIAIYVFISLVAVSSMIGNEDKIESHSIGFSEESFGQLSGEGLIDEMLESIVFGQGFQDGGGDGSVIGRAGEISTCGEEGLGPAKVAKEGIDDNGVVAEGAVILFFEQTAGGFEEVLFDRLVSCGKIPS